MTPEEVLAIALAGDDDAEELKRAMLSPEFVRSLAERIEASPREQVRRRLVVDYGERHGGLTLELLLIFDGAYWGTGMELTFEQCSRVLNVPSDKLEQIYDDMLDEIRPHLDSEPRTLGAGISRSRGKSAASTGRSRSSRSHQSFWRTKRGRTA